MNVMTFGILEAKDGLGEELAKLVEGHMEVVKSQPGLIKGYIGKSKGNSDKYVVLSIWENEEAQQTAMAKLSTDPGAAAGFIQLLAVLKGHPEFGNYEVESITK